MPNRWAADDDVAVIVQVSGAGPLDPLYAGQTFQLTDHAGRNYVDGNVGITIRRGRSDEFGHFQPGTCTLTLHNDNREFDPTNASSPFISILKPRRMLRVITGRVSDFSTFTILFTGYIDAWPQAWTKTTGTVEVVAHDLLSVLSQTTTSPASGALILDNPYQGRLDFGRLAGELPQQSTGERVAALIGLAGLSSQVVDIAHGLTDVLGLDPTGDVLELCQQAEEAEAGFLFVDAYGVLRFLDRHSRFQHPRLGTVQASFTDSEYSGLAVDFNLNQMWNDVRFSRPSQSDLDMPVEAVKVNDDSIALYGRRVYSQSIPVTNDGETLGRAEFWLNRFGVPQQRPAPVTIKPRRDLDSLFMRTVRRELLDRVQLTRTPLGIGPPITYTGLVEQVEHRITRDDWQCSIGISPIDVDEGSTFLVLNSATLGQLDQEALAY
jgi:hypothetical protein